MQTKTLQQTITFSASPKEVYDTLANSKKHQSLSGMPAKISKKVGGKFTAWGSHLTGVNLVLRPGKKIVQAWRATGWWPDHYSIAIFDISKVRDGTKLIDYKRARRAHRGRSTVMGQKRCSSSSQQQRFWPSV